MRLTSVQDEGGHIRNDRQEIVDAFATFYETLYARRTEEETCRRTCSTSCGIPKITAKEVSKQLQMMKNGKSADSKAIVVEMLNK